MSYGIRSTWLPPFLSLAHSFFFLFLLRLLPFFFPFLFKKKKKKREKKNQCMLEKSIWVEHLCQHHHWIKNRRQRKTKDHCRFQLFLQSCLRNVWNTTLYSLQKETTMETKHAGDSRSQNSDSFIVHTSFINLIPAVTLRSRVINFFNSYSHEFPKFAHDAWSHHHNPFQCRLLYPIHKPQPPLLTTYVITRKKKRSSPTALQNACTLKIFKDRLLQRANQ